MILIGAIATTTLADVAILIVAQATRRAAEFAVATATAAVTGAIDRQLIRERSIPRGLLIKTQTGTGIEIQIAAATGIVAGTKIEIATKIRTRTETRTRIKIATGARTAIAIGTRTKIKTGIEAEIAIVTRTATEIVAKTPDEGMTVIAILTTSTPPSTMSETTITTITV
jgi:hypothetical protein